MTDDHRMERAALLNIAGISNELQALSQQSSGDVQICVAVLDGAVDRTHPCFQGANLTVLDTLASEQEAAGGALAHGTHVTSVIFGQPGSSVPGIAPGCRGMIVPIFRSGGNGAVPSCLQVDLARAISQAVDAGAHLINISGGQLEASGQAEPLLADAVRRCAQAGVLIVAATGNDGCRCLHVPAALPGVLGVGAMDAQGKPARMSNWGETYRSQAILAPGQDILGAAPGGGTARRTGTSFATPVVTGIVALLLTIQLRRGEKPDPLFIRHALLESAFPCNPQQVSECQRALNIAGAYQIVVQTPLLPAVTPSSNDTSSNGSPSEEVSNPDSAQTLMEPALQAFPGSAILPNSLKNLTEDLMLESNLPANPGTGGASASIADADTLFATSPATLSSQPTVTASEVSPSDCACGCGGTKKAPQLVYAIGALGYDFTSEARRDAIQAEMGVSSGLSVHSPGDLLAHLENHPYQAADILWTLKLEETPIYAILPHGPYAETAYSRLRQFLNGELHEGVERISVPGVVMGQVTLLNHQSVPVIVPSLRGMYSWSTSALIEAVAGVAPAEGDALTAYNANAERIRNFLTRVYYELRNLGTTSSDRALNYAATNAYQAHRAFNEAARQNLELDSITTERSPICKPDADCWDVLLTFFNPSRRTEQARRVYRFSVDVSDVVPVSVGQMRTWTIY